MQEIIYNPQKGRLETKTIEYSNKNTTWFDNCSKPDDIYMLTDLESGLLIKENNQSYPVLIYDVSRKELNNSALKAKELMEMAL